jgi:hypothetical protein
MKVCTKCATEKPFSGFHKDKTHSDGLRSFCKTCVGAYSKKYHELNREKIVAKAKVWVEQNRQRHNEKCNRWAKANPEKVNARTARRYAAKTQATPSWLSEDDQWVIVEAYALAKLRAKMLGGKWEVDHVVPLRGRGVMGLHVPWNLKVVPMQQNRRKSNILSAT